MNAIATALRAYWPLAAAAALGLALGWLLFHSRQPAVHQVVTDRVQQTAVATTTKDAASETTKDSGPTRKVVLDFDPHCPPAVPVRAGDPLPPSILRQTIYEAGPTQVVTRAATELRAAEQVQTTEDHHLDLTITPPAQPRWAVQLGVEDALSARSLRVAGRMRLFGPLWLELSAVPLQRSVGVAAAVEW